MTEGFSAKHRSECPVSAALEVLGDRWSLLIIRDLMVRGLRSFLEFLTSGEGIATNILSDRLRKLLSAGIIVEERDAADRRRVIYRLTEKGIDLAPVLFEMLIWGARHSQTSGRCEEFAKMAQNRDWILAEVRRRWEERDPEPLLPPPHSAVQPRIAQRRSTGSRPGYQRKVSAGKL